MAKSIAEWQAMIIAAKEADEVIGTAGTNPLSSTSTVSIWRLWTRIVASAMFDLGSLFDFHKAEVAAKIAAEKAHTLNWYGAKARAYQHGDSLPDGSDVYDPVKDDDDAALVVDYAAVVEAGSMLRVKVATGVPGALTAISVGELAGLAAYMKRIKDAGVRITCTTGTGDVLQPKLKIHYDPLILDDAGARLDGTGATPVKDAINSFLAAIPFNGRFVIEDFVVYMNGIEGVKITEVEAIQAYYAATPAVVFTDFYNADEGYLVLDDVYMAANITYEAYFD